MGKKTRTPEKGRPGQICWKGSYGRLEEAPGGGGKDKKTASTSSAVLGGGIRQEKSKREHQ